MREEETATCRRDRPSSFRSLRDLESWSSERDSNVEESPVSAALKRSFSLIWRSSDFFGGPVSMSTVKLYGRIAGLGSVEVLGIFYSMGSMSCLKKVFIILQVV